MAAGERSTFSIPERQGNYWLGQVENEPVTAARGSIAADVVVVGGGITGLSAARRLSRFGLDVILLEADLSGSGATGKSSGFITPDSELKLSNLIQRFGDADAAVLWQAAQGACDAMRADVDAWQLPCDLVPADSFWVARSQREVAAIQREHEAHARLGFASRLYQGDEVGDVLGGSGFAAGVRSPGTFGMNALAYVRGLRRAVASLGVRCFERSRVTTIEGNEVRTADAVVRAAVVVVCLDRYAPTIDIATKDNFHAQAFLTLTEPLGAATWSEIFPEAPLLVWDSDLVYQYFRRTREGRLLVGGGRLIETFAAEHPHSRSFAKLERYARARFAGLRDVRFTHAWQGLLGISKDVLPIAGRSLDEPSQHLAMCGAGLPWSVLAGECAAALVAGQAAPLARFFAPERRFPWIERFQPVLGKPVTWALSYLIAR